MRDFIYMSPKGPKKVPLMRFGQWVEVYPNEGILVHKTMEKRMETFGFVRAKYQQKVFKTIRDALKSQEKIGGLFTE